MEDKTISIKAEDTDNIRPPEKTDIYLENGDWVTSGIPTTEELNAFGGFDIKVPDTPHVFTAKRLQVFDKKHNPGAVLEDVCVLLAHGIREEERWRFLGNNQSVSGTVEAYNKHAREHGLSEIEFVAVCNQDRGAHRDIKVEEFSTEKVIAHSVGEEVGVRGSVGVDGAVDLTVSAEDDSEIARLDDLLTLKSVKVTSN